MKPRDLTDLALRNLREAILRNVLTTLGVAVGVASLVAMLSLGVGLQQLASKRLSQSGLFDTIFVTPKNSFRGMGRAQREMESDKPPRPLDEGARKEFEKLPNVIEVFPQIRFFTEVRFNNKPYATVVAGLPESSRNSGAFDGMQGNFFSSPTADEAILQIEFAKDLSDKPASLLGQAITLRYAERQAIPAAGDSSSAPSEASEGFSVVPKELKLKIIGVVETEPAAGYGGYGNARLLMPLDTASTLRAAQVNDLRDIVRGSTANKVTFPSLSVRASSPSKVEALEASIKSMGFNAFSLLDASKSLRTFFSVFDLLLGIFG
ncbi:MAG TPA: ABC transporter permease, partial [Candidatus Acidoferrum sp.]|nr:ABC transporter permease [Candidatus Acidoferrum sp.]